jgi:AcrR family transcriptional regulator
MTIIRKTVNKVRRNSEEVDRDILLATKELIEEFGFNKLTLAKIAEKASLAPNMFYKRYPDLDKLIEKFIKKYDYRFNDIMEIPFNKSIPQEYYKTIMSRLIELLYENKAMQQILIYELSNDNPVTRRAAKLRELDFDSGLSEYDEIFKETDIDIRTHTALIIAGIYYLILHKDRSTFCGIDLTTDDGKRRLNETITLICDTLFQIVERKKEVLNIAKKLKNENVEISVIAKCTGILREEIESL